MERFKYYPPLFINNIVFLTLTALFLLFLETKGAAAWAWCMQRMGIQFFVVVIGFAFYLLVFWGAGIPYLLLDKFKKPLWLYKYKIQDIPDERRRKSPKVPLLKAILRVLSNQFLGTWPFLFGLFYLMKELGYADTIEIPSWWVALLQLATLILIEDILFFAAHHTMHRKYFFNKIHRVHHEYRESIAIATHYVHFIEHLVGNLIPVFAGVLLLQPHPFVVLFWIFMVVINALHTHSGYAFPWMAYSVHHDWHHYHVNGSFSAIGLMDQIFGTDKAFNKLKKEHKQLTNKELKN
jgi:sterol desaturase/sphingolipid hydroxylase (fatty acid hydroxylase superfamily)